MREVRLIGALSGTETTERLTRLNALRKRLLQESASTPIESTRPPPRIGAIADAVSQVLTDAPEAMHVSEIHKAVEQRLGRPVNYRSVKSCLSEGASRRNPRFLRTAYGCYRLA